MLRRIVDGTWKPGSYLPSEPQLATDLGVSIGTIRKAMEDLVGQGLLERQHGRGTQVVPHSSARSRFRFLRFVHPDGRPFSPVAHVLAAGIHAGRSAGPRPARARRDGARAGPAADPERGRRPPGLRAHRLPAAPFAGLNAEPGTEMLRRSTSLPGPLRPDVARARDEIATDRADPAVAQALGCAPGRPCSASTGSPLSLTGAPIEHTPELDGGPALPLDLD